MKILLIEDEPDLLGTIEENLKQEGFRCETACTLTSASQKIDFYNYDLVILDIGLPDGDGMELLSQIKHVQKQAGVLIISAKNTLDDKIKGLDLGADDYLTKPFHLAELNARVRSIIRRRHFKGEQSICFQQLEFRPEENLLKGEKQAVVLTKKEHDLLLYFLANPNRLLTKAAIAEHLWGDYMDLADNFDLVYTHVKNLRKKIRNLGGKDCITTVYGLGYKLVTE